MSKIVVTKKIEMNECKRCGYRWVSRTSNPKACPDCKSRYWDKEKKQTRNKHQG